MRRPAMTALPEFAAPLRGLIPTPRRSLETVLAGGPPTFREPCAPLVRAGLTVTGFGLAAVFYCLSFTPSLLPRPWVLQGVVAGITAATGYGVGTALGALIRLRWSPGERTVRIAWRVLFALVPPLIVLFLFLGVRWQRELRERLGMAPPQEYDLARTVGLSLLTFGVLLLIARALRLATHGMAHVFGLLVPETAAYCAGFLVVSLVSYTAFDGLLVDNLYTTADRSAAITDSGTGRGVVRPRTPLRSGGPGSLVSWDSLGRQGRNFVASAPTLPQLSAFAGRPATQPIRLYAGLASADSAQKRAETVVREMDRTGAFRRAVIAVLTPTGTGWVDNNVTSSLEYMYDGDTALVSMQYSYLPSWISFLFDRSQAAEAAAALITAVHDRWAAMPPTARPKLLIFGESLGTYGTEKTFGTARKMVEGADGILLEGPTFANPIHQQLTGGRSPDSTVWDPAYGDLPVAFASTAPELRDLVGSPARPKVVYMQNSSDPVVWWNPSLLWRRPGWLHGRRGPDVTRDMHWYPGITFWQTTVDLAFANKAPTGHGHVYKSATVDGWAALAPPPGWTTGDSVRLRALLDQ
jgi:uncharacterized membrane protein